MAWIDIDLFWWLALTIQFSEVSWYTLFTRFLAVNFSISKPFRVLISTRPMR